MTFDCSTRYLPEHFPPSAPLACWLPSSLSVLRSCFPSFLTKSKYRPSSLYSLTRSTARLSSVVQSSFQFWPQELRASRDLSWFPPPCFSSFHPPFPPWSFQKTEMMFLVSSLNGIWQSKSENLTNFLNIDVPFFFFCSTTSATSTTPLLTVGFSTLFTGSITSFLRSGVSPFLTGSITSFLANGFLPFLIGSVPFGVSMGFVSTFLAGTLVILTRFETVSRGRIFHTWVVLAWHGSLKNEFPTVLSWEMSEEVSPSEALILAYEFFGSGHLPQSWNWRNALHFSLKR